MKVLERDRIGCQPPIRDPAPLGFAEEPHCLTARRRPSLRGQPRREQLEGNAKKIPAFIARAAVPRTPPG